MYIVAFQEDARIAASELQSCWLDRVFVSTWLDGKRNCGVHECGRADRPSNLGTWLIRPGAYALRPLLNIYHARMARRAQHLRCSLRLCERSERADNKLDKLNIGHCSALTRIESLPRLAPWRLLSTFPSAYLPSSSSIRNQQSMCYTVGYLKPCMASHDAARPLPLLYRDREQIIMK